MISLKFTKENLSFAGLLFLLQITVTLVHSAFGASICEQTFTIYGKTEGTDAALAFEEHIGGECQDRTLYMLILNDTLKPIILTSYASSDSDSRVTSFLQKSGDETPDTVVMIVTDQQRFSFGDGISFTLPPVDTTFSWKLGRLANEGSADAAHWRRECPVNCQDYPSFEGARGTLLYEHQSGIYKNYNVAQCLWYGDSHILVIVTDQPRRAVGMDTMHGVLVYHVETNHGEGEQ